MSDPGRSKVMVVLVARARKRTVRPEGEGIEEMSPEFLRRNEETMSMNMDHLDDWIAALRSDRFTQGTGQMRTDCFDSEAGGAISKFCCLAVGCEVAGIEYKPTDLLPKKAFAEWLGFDEVVISDNAESLDWIDENGFTVAAEDDYARGVDTLNDDDGYTFEQIADWLDTNRHQLVASR